MPQYILRDIPEGLWKRVKTRAERDGWPLRALMLQLLEDFAVGRVTPGGTPPIAAEGRTVTEQPPARRAAVVHFHGGKTVRIPEAAYATEDASELVFFDASQRPLGRISRPSVDTWYFEDPEREG
jgi:hypothetical protein